MPAPRVLPKENHTAPRLSLVDNVGEVADSIVNKAQDQNDQWMNVVELPPLPAPQTRGRYRRHLKLEGRGRNGDVEVRRYAGPCHPTALAVAEEITARRGGYIHITGPCTVAVRNYPPEGLD